MMSNRFPWLTPVLIAAALAAGACTNSIGGRGGGDDDVGDDDDDGPDIDPDEPRELCADGDADKPGPRLLRRLTSLELETSVRDVFGLNEVDWAGPALPSDPAGRNGFTNNVDRLVVDGDYAKQLLETAKDVAEVVTTGPHLGRLLPCTATGGDACAAEFLDTIGRRLFRRPLDSEERGRYLALFQSVADNGDLFTDWAFWTTVGMLQSPHFMYRSELGAAAGAGYQLTGYEVATALAFNLTGHPPSDALLDRAASGGLADADAIAAAARDLAIDPASGAVRPELRQVFLRFSDQWLGLSSLGNLSKSATDFPNFVAEIRNGMKRETDAFISHVVFDEGGGVADLLTAPVSYVDGTLAGYYGWGDPTQTTATQAERPEGWGVGILSQGSVLAINAGNVSTSPTQRGLLVRERLLCYEPPPPPAVVGDLPQPTGNETTRERYEELHAGNPVCAGCHVMFDPIGFAFEHLDAAGRYRATEGTLPIDDSGFIAGFGANIEFVGPAELAAALAARPEPSTCAASYMASFAFGLDHHDTSCLVSSLSDKLETGELGIIDYYVALAQAPYFTTRTD